MQQTSSTALFSRKLTVDLIDGGAKPESRSFECTPEKGSLVSAGDLKAGFLISFGAANPVLEAEAMGDENQSYHLTGIDSEGKRSAFRDDEDVDLNRYSQFELLPRTVGGTGKRIAR